ncbi:hypothetical protein HJG60_010522 [Phyllostomus discolor]|uniref:transketolase n=1 Tax=Phyllostomus discolor TaxID=89673 RepID=A0A834ANA1_9CHIR|nr:hypothetical protein HJG60_010522 [Phyllostomus discolor]
MMELAASTKGICFIPTSCPENAIIYNNNEDFQIGQAKVVLKSKDDQVTVIGAGVLLQEALAAEERKDQYPGRILTVEDHYYEGGIGEAVSSAVVGESGITVVCLAIGQVMRSGKLAELLKMFGIEKDAIAQVVRSLVTKA